MDKYLNTKDEEDHPPENGPLKAGVITQMVKQRDAQGKLRGVDIRVIYGDDTTLSQTGTRTTCVERTNLTSRLMNGRLVRKTLGFSKQLEMLSAACVWEAMVYNLTRPVKTLRLEVFPQTDRLWSIRELLMTVSVPTNPI